jgi:nitroreductase
MNVSTAIQTRRSIKAFDPEHRMSDVEITHLMSLALLSPTAFNIQNWRFVLVSDSELRRQLRAVAWDQAQVTDASLLIILAADIKAWQKEPSRYWKNVPQTIREFLLPVIDQYYRGREQAQRDEAMRSCGMAAMTLMLAAEEMGYASCPMDGFDFDAVAKLIHLPEDYVISMFVAIGKGIKEAWPRGGQLPLEEVIIHNKF